MRGVQQRDKERRPDICLKMMYTVYKVMDSMQMGESDDAKQVTKS